MVWVLLLSTAINSWQFGELDGAENGDELSAVVTKGLTELLTLCVLVQHNVECCPLYHRKEWSLVDRTHIHYSQWLWLVVYFDWWSVHLVIGLIDWSIDGLHDWLICLFIYLFIDFFGLLIPFIHSFHSFHRFIYSFLYSFCFFSFFILLFLLSIRAFIYSFLRPSICISIWFIH